MYNKIRVCTKKYTHTTQTNQYREIIKKRQNKPTTNQQTMFKKKHVMKKINQIRNE
jgi:hypothetical protein